MDVSCIILAGGRSRRLGRNKLTELIRGKSLLERVVARLSPLTEQIIIVAAKDSVLPDLSGSSRIRIINDIFPGKGSLGGIYSGLNVSKTTYNLGVACDMPFLNLDLVKYMINNSNGYDVIVPQINNVFEPLHAIYSKNCLTIAKELIMNNRLSILDLYSRVKVKIVLQSEIDVYDPQHLSFFNINTEADLKHGIELASKEGSLK